MIYDGKLGILNERFEERAETVCDEKIELQSGKFVKMNAEFDVKMKVMNREEKYVMLNENGKFAGII